LPHSALRTRPGSDCDRVDQRARGLPITVLTRIAPERHDTQTIAELRGIADSLAGYERFVLDAIHTIPGIASIDTGFACGVVNHALALPRRGV